ncbi:toxin glutamine deamidase domain-containing protein [Streptomyces sp. DT2A-34]|uniref:toxin glutamine deamidase domain-containing protein n=1 Tax=Streptomyces sp. DT2A-34 TaxID=3051182 RepID=UPI00265C1E7F|nr:toxin glutamine deamidase domain-containing protein [Streptomyces sp. DT2A-34]MDO0911297.1 toxin glutamine deamidase domain-containing protein [Streptomyces sp. DT2A-34]
MTAVPIHTVVTTPGSTPPHADPATPQSPGSPQANPGNSNNQSPQQDSLDDIRSDLDHAPGGLSQPDQADQQALADAVPHNEDGTPQRFPDPFGPWAQLQNDGGNTVPGRSNNCADCSRSFLETWYGNPQVSAPRTVDLDENGKHNPFTPEDNANANQIRWTGAAHTYAGPGGDPNTANNIASTLQQAGPGSAAIVQVDWPGGGGHAFNVVNHNGKIVWIDTQSGEVSDKPLHVDQAKHVWHIPLDADRNPIDTTQPKDKDSEEAKDSEKAEQGTDTPQEGSDNAQQEADNASDGPENQQADQPDHAGEAPSHTPGENLPHSESDRVTTPGQDETSPRDNGTRTNEASTPSPDRATNPAPEPQSDAPSDRSDTSTRPGADAPTTDRSSSQQHPVTDPRAASQQHSPTTRSADPRGQDPSTRKPHRDERPDATRDTPARPDRPADNTRDDDTARRGPENPAGQDAHPHDDPSDPTGDKNNTKDPDDRPYDEPHDRGTSDTAAESRRVTEDGPDSDVSRTHEAPEGDKAKEYGIEPDTLQQGLRREQAVHRVELDRVHDRLDRWAESGDLANVMRATTGQGPLASPDGSRSFTRDQLSNSLPGFGDLSRGEQQAVVASLARLSLSFHQEHAVGRSPERIPHPYRNDGEDAPGNTTPDRGAKLSKESLGVRLHRMAMNALFKRAEFKTLEEKNPEKLKEIKRHGPDFSGKNYAVLELQGPPPKNDVHYIVDSSVPANKQLKGVQPRHSERHLLDWLKRMDPDGSKYTPLGLYTEREPCGEGQGHAKCSDTLQDERLKGIPIHYSTTYRDDPVGVAARGEMADDKKATLKQMANMSDQERRQLAEEVWREHYKDDQAGLEKALKKLDSNSGSDLIKAIRGEFDAQRKGTSTHKEDAIKAEFDRHISALQGTWKKLRADIQGPPQHGG